MRTWRHTRGDLTVTERRTRLSEAGAWVIVVGLMVCVAGGVGWAFKTVSDLPTLEASEVVLEVPAAPPPATPDDMGRMIRNPAWAVRPSIDYPEAAARAGIEEGKVELICEALADGRIGACRTLSETPTGYGFAAAADQGMRTARIYPHQIDDFPTDARIQFTTRFAVAPMIAIDRNSPEGRRLRAERSDRPHP